MTWSLNAAGHTPTPEGEESSEGVEQELHERLAEVLSDPKYGCGTSSFHGNHVHGTVHLHNSDQTEHVHDTGDGD